MLARLRKMTQEKEEGFTLIELLVVMIIIGILAAIAIPVFLNQQKKGYDASVKSDLRTVANELQTYYTDNQTYLANPWGNTSAVVAPLPAASAADTINYSDANHVVGPDSINVSNGTTIQMVKGGVNGFCLKGTNTKDSAATYYYDSLNGGLQVGSATCTTGTY
jgi:type IV pilus assembly protein PilA